MRVPFLTRANICLLEGRNDATLRWRSLVSLRRCDLGMMEYLDGWVRVKGHMKSIDSTLPLLSLEFETNQLQQLVGDSSQNGVFNENQCDTGVNKNNNNKTSSQI